MPNKGRRVSMRIVHRHHFSSALKRMSAIVSVQNPGSSSSEYVVTVKGAPETLRPMVSDCLIVSCKSTRLISLGFAGDMIGPLPLSYLLFFQWQLMM